MHRLVLLALAVLLVTSPAAADDVWSTPYPGIRMLRRTTTQPVVMWALLVDSCAAGIRFRATSPTEGPRTTSSFGRLVGAQVAINGDFFDHDFGLNLGNGAAWPYPDTDHSGDFSVGPGRIEMTPDYVVLPGPYPWVTEQLGGRWTLLDNGVAQRGIDDNGPAAGGFVCAPGLRHPRTAIGLSRDRRTVMLVVADGRTSASIGMTCDELIDLFTELGAHDAVGLDGGGSTTLWTSASGVVNHPTDATGERTVRNHLAVFASGTGAAVHCGYRPVVVEPTQAMAVTTATLPTVVALTAPSRFAAVAPVRLFDTRGADTSARLVRGDGGSTGPLSQTSGGAFRAWAEVGVPSSASAVWLNVTTTDARAPGFLTVYPDGRPRPLTSSVNFAPTVAVANAAPVALGAGSVVRFDPNTAVEVIADLAGVFTPTGAGLTPVPPTRVLDTRATMTPLRARAVTRVDVRAPSDATAVAATVTAIARGTPGFLTAFPCDAPTPTTSNVNFAGDAIVANAVLSGLGAGRLCLMSSVDTDVVVDVTGYLTPAAPLSYVALFPQRLLDTRESGSLYAGRVGEGQALTLPIQRLPGAPANVGAVVANLTVTDAADAGYLTAYPCGGDAPATSSLNFTADRATSALALSALADGALCLRASTRAHVIVDVVGLWVAPPPAPDGGVATPDVVVPRDATPADIATTTDAPAQPDARADATDALPPDGGDMLDGAALPRDTTLRGGCGCRATRPPTTRGAALAGLLLAGVGWRRRARRLV